MQIDTRDVFEYAVKERDLFEMMDGADEGKAEFYRGLVEAFEMTMAFISHYEEQEGRNIARQHKENK